MMDGGKRAFIEQLAHLASDLCVDGAGTVGCRNDGQGPREVLARKPVNANTVLKLAAVGK